MGILDRLKRANPLSTFNVISSVAHDYHARYPEVSFRVALERSLVETRPGWTAGAVLAMSRFLDEARTPAEMVEVAVQVDAAMRDAARRGSPL